MKGSSRAYDREECAALKSYWLSLLCTNGFTSRGKKRRNFSYDALNLLGANLGIHGQRQDFRSNSLANRKAAHGVLKVAIGLL